MQRINVDIYKEKKQSVTDAYERLVAKLPYLKSINGKKVFTITGCEPGVGATNIAINAAIALSEMGYKTLFVDADLRKKPEAKRLSGLYKTGLVEVILGVSEYDEVLCSTEFENLYCMFSGKQSENPINIISSDKFDMFIELVESRFDYVIIDSPAISTTIDAGVIASKTAGAVMVLGYGVTKKKSIEFAEKELEQTQSKLLGVVLNKVEKKQYKRFLANFDYYIPKLNGKKTK